MLDTAHDPAYGEAVRIAGLVQRVTAANPSPFTFAGTGTYIVGRQRVAVIDPGPDDAAHVTSLLRALEGRTVTHICVTHTHSDHSPASRALAAATGAPVFGFGPHPAGDIRRGGEDPAAVTEEPGDWDFIPDVTLAHGDVLADEGWTLECLHTPGHISNHLCFALPEGRAVFTGDHVMGWSSTIIPPPDGNLGDYLRSLELLIDRGDRDEVYWPTHGPPITSPARYVRALLAHRHRRTAQILECLREGPATIPALVARMYTDTPKMLHPAAERSVLAHLIHLAERGRVSAEPDDDDRTRRYDPA
ncbi:MAG: MBL fold metallo-hydrolase [bacterium]|nr:MBL fold metallo-hydrolase [bacterium]